MWKLSRCNEINVIVTKHLHGTQLIVIIDNAILRQKVLMTTIGDGRWAGGSFFFVLLKFAVFEYRKLLVVNFNGGLKNGRWTETTQSLE
jgi:hypothetical protein